MSGTRTRARVLLSTAAASALLLGAQMPTASVLAAGPGIGVLPQGTQTNAQYAASFAAQHVANVFATTQKQISCFRPEVLAPAPSSMVTGVEHYTGETPCPASGATTGEDIGASPYPSQNGSNPGYATATPMQVKDHAESNLRVDPTNSRHLIGVSKWFVTAEGDSNVDGFFESFDGGKTWPVQGHIPGYEGWTSNTDPDGAFDGFGNFYVLLLPYQFFYRADGSHNFATGTSQLPNPSEPAEVIAVAVHPHGATGANDWTTNRVGSPDIVAAYPVKGQAPDKPWLAIDNHPTRPDGTPNPNYNTIYTAWVTFDNAVRNSKPYMATARAQADGAHTAWTSPQLLPTVTGTANDYYPTPQVDGSGTVWVAMQHYPSTLQRTTADITLISSTDGGTTWQGPFVVVQGILVPPPVYDNTTFLYDQIINFAISPRPLPSGTYPLYVAWEDYSLGVSSVVLSGSMDGGRSWSSPIQVNDNQSLVHEIQPSIAVAGDGTVSVAFYDRRLVCPTKGSAEAKASGIDQDLLNSSYAGTLPPYGAANYCMNASVQFYKPALQPLGHNIRLTQHTWDPQLNAIRTSCSACAHTWMGDYFGNTTNGSLNVSTFVSTYDPGNGTNPNHYQQQVIASIPLPAWSSP
jgi:hypothetical protein